MAQGSTNKGLARAQEIYNNRSKRARDLKADGKKVMGYFCCYPPLEIMAGLGFLPVRILGDMNEPRTVADGYLPPVMCIFYRSCFDVGMKDQYDFIDGFVGAHACDGAERTSHVWRSYIKSPCGFYLDVPHTGRKESLQYFKEQLEYMKKTLEEFAGQKLDDNRLREAISLYNKQRGLVRNLYELTKSDPPLITGSEILKVIIAIMLIPVEEGNNLLQEVIEEIKSRGDGPEKKTGRLLIWGSLIDNTALTELIENSGFNIVIDDTAIGTRPFWHDVEETSDPMEGIARHYLQAIRCPRTFIQTGKTHKDDLEKRFGYLSEFARDWKVNAALGNIVRNCDPHGYEVPDVKEYIEDLGIPMLIVEQDYSTTALEPLRTRFQAFAERIG